MRAIHRPLHNLSRLLILSACIITHSTFAAEPDQTSLQTARERQDNHPQHALNHWLSVGAAAEAEYRQQRFRVQHADFQSSNQVGNQLETSLELNAEITINPSATFELAYTYTRNSETDPTAITTTHIEQQLDEAFFTLDYDIVEIELGRFTLPFGEYLSHFSNEPMLEFGETDSHYGVVFNTDVQDALELKLFTYRTPRTPAARFGWGASATSTHFANTIFGLGIISNLATPTNSLFEDEEISIAQRLAAINGYVKIDYPHHSVSAEFTHSLNRFTGFEAAFSRPSAWNVEFAQHLQSNITLALRLEGSHQLADTPTLQGGIAFNWQINPNIILEINYLNGRYRQFTGTDPSDQAQRLQQISSLISVQF